MSNTTQSSAQFLGAATCFASNGEATAVKTLLRSQQARAMSALSPEALINAQSLDKEVSSQNWELWALAQTKIVQRRAQGFDHIFSTHFIPPDKVVSKRGIIRTPPVYNAPATQWWISELKIRYLTNIDLTDQKLNSLLRVIHYYDSIYSSVESSGSSTSIIAIDSPLRRLEQIIGIQVAARTDEAIIAVRLGGAISVWTKEFANIGATVDFIRDLKTLRALGFFAPHLQTTIDTYTRHPKIDLSIALPVYRRAMEAALLTFYWKDPKYFALIKNSDVVESLEDPSIRSQDDRARDYNIGMLPVEVIAVLSEYVRGVVYDLTRSKAPSIELVKKRWNDAHPNELNSLVLRAKKIIFSRKPDLNRITLAQELELARLRREKSRP